jgi:hypothetical protein
VTKCKVCRSEFVKRSITHKCCSPECAEIFGREQTKKQVAKKEREETKVRKEKLKRLPDWIADAQVIFNKYIRLRDSGLPCICCGRINEAQNTLGGVFDAGHYRSRGSAGHLRFYEDNCHAQLKQCNRWGAGRAVDYRIGLIQRIGLERVEALEANNIPHKWTVEELKEIIATYKRKIKELETSRANG